MAKRCHARSILLTSLAFASVGLLSIPRAHANFDFSPISSHLLTEGRSSSLMAKLVNRSNTQLPIVIKVFERTMAEDGEELRQATEDLEVFPKQLLLGPKEERFVKILWKGPKDLAHEKAFRVLVDHVPVDMSAKTVGGGAIRIMLSYSAMVYVASRQVAPRVEITRIVPDEKSERRLLVTIENSGDAHSILTSPQLELTCLGSSTPKQITLKSAALKNLDSRNMLARSKLNTSINVPSGFSKCSGYEWSFRYEIP